MRTQLGLARTSKSSGFTLVEIIVVIAVVAILAVVSVVSFGAWRNRLAENEVKSDLTSVVSVMESARTFSNSYPSAIPATFSPSKNVTMNYAWGDGKEYCINAQSNVVASVKYYVKISDSKEPQSGVCGAAGDIAAPVIASAVVNGSQVVVTWSAVGGATSYNVQKRLNGAGAWDAAVNVTTTNNTFSGLTLGSTYQFQVTAKKSIFESPTSNIVSATLPAAIPGAPTIASATVTNTQAVITWGAVSGATGYDVQKRLIGASVWDAAVSTTSPSNTFTGLALNNTYQFQSRAKNSGGTSNWSTVVQRVTIQTPSFTSVTGLSCGNNGGYNSWFSATVALAAVSKVYAQTYEVGYVHSGSNSDAGPFYSVPKIITNTLTSNGTLNLSTSTSVWRADSNGSAELMATGVGPNGERSGTATWVGASNPPYTC